MVCRNDNQSKLLQKEVKALLKGYFTPVKLIKVDADQADQRLKIALCARSEPMVLLVYKSTIELIVQGNDCME